MYLITYRIAESDDILYIILIKLQVKEKHYFDMAPHLLIRCIQGIQVNGSDDFSSGPGLLFCLAFHIYYSLVRN